MVGGWSMTWLSGPGSDRGKTSGWLVLLSDIVSEMRRITAQRKLLLGAGTASSWPRSLGATGCYTKHRLARP